MRYQWFVLGFFAMTLGAHAAEDLQNKKSTFENSTTEKSVNENGLGSKRNNWIELAVGSVSALEFKTSKDNRGWALAFSAYDDLEILGDGYLTKDGLHSIDDGASELALMRTFSNRGRWFYADASIGIGYMNATVAENCESVTTTGGGSFFGSWSSTTHYCDEKHKKGISIPLELDIAWGRYAGIGLKLRASIGPESKGGVALIIPLGTFAKR